MVKYTCLIFKMPGTIAFGESYFSDKERDRRRTKYTLLAYECNLLILSKSKTYVSVNKAISLWESILKKFWHEKA